MRNKILLCMTAMLALMAGESMAQTAGQIVIQKRKASGPGYDALSATPANSAAVSFDGAGNMVLKPWSEIADLALPAWIGSTNITTVGTITTGVWSATPIDGTKVEVQHSIVQDGEGLRLSGDSGSPGNNKVYGTDGTGTKGWYDAAAGGGHVDVQVFTTSGTWIKPAGATRVHIRMIGGGAGGGSGATAAPGVAAVAGGGGSPGSCVDVWFDAGALDASEPVTVGVGGVGGVGVSTPSVSGQTGTAGTSSIFDTLTAAGGNAGATWNSGGLSTGASGYHFPLTTTHTNPSGGGTSPTGGNGSNGSSAGISAYLNPGNGSGGGGVDSGDTARDGGNGGPISTTAVPVSGVTVPGGAGGVGTNGGNGATNEFGVGTGGGGGGGNASGNGFNGGNGGFPGGAGGGGGAARDGFTSGAGGNGGNGLVVITTYLAP